MSTRFAARSGTAAGSVRFGALVAAVFLAAHLPFLPTSPDDVDAVNFVLGVQDYDIAAHQPHPPGYPVFIGLGKLASAAVGPLALTGDAGRTYLALALIAAVFGAIAVIPLAGLFRAVEHVDRRARAAAILTLSSPLFWLTSARPLSDVPGLTAALAVQAMLAVWLSPPRDGAAYGDRVLWIAAFLAGLTIGIRTQTFMLTLPMLALACLARSRRPGAVRAVTGVTLAGVAGVGLWAVPMLVATGGLGHYLAATDRTAREDFAEVAMLATRFTPGALARSLIDTFVQPWASPVLGGIVLAAAAAGGAVMARDGRRGLAVLTVSIVPYVAFHLAFHETLTTRYALPIVPAVAYLAVCGVDHWLGRAMWPAVAGLALFGIGLSVPVQSAVGRDVSPVRAAFQQAQEVWQVTPGPVVAMHNSVSLAARGEPLTATRLEAPAGAEWLEMLEYWRQGGTEPIWFFANARRTDLALVDPASRRHRGSYRWGFDTDRFLGGARPTAIDWYEIQPPGWILGRGWALTPEIGGRSTAFRRRSRRTYLDGLVRRDLTGLERTFMIGGRNLASEEDVEVDVSLDGDSFYRFRPAPGPFLQMARLPAGDILPSSHGYATLRVDVHTSRGAGHPDVRFEQFDLQPATTTVFGYDTGWHEPEYDPSSGTSWRWTSAAATLRLDGPGRLIMLRIRGEAPAKYFGGAVTVEIRAGDRVVTRFQPTDDFEWTIPVPYSALRASGGTVTIRTDRTFVPAEAFGSADRRTLGLRIYDVQLVHTP